MKRTIFAFSALTFAFASYSAIAATKHAAEKGPPACSALTFRAAASGASDGDQQAGYYRSRYGSLALHAQVKGGQATDYFVLADGKKLNAAPASLPDWAGTCAEKKQLPKPSGAGTSPCTGQHFKVVLAHDAKDRLALLYGLDGSTWHFCSAGSY